MPSLLEVQGLSTGYGVVRVLEDVSIRVEPGEIAPPDSGARIEFEDEDGNPIYLWEPRAAAFAAGAGPAECVDHRCYYFCETDDECPDELECVGRGDLLPNDPYPSGECMAPYSEP